MNGEFRIVVAALATSLMLASCTPDDAREPLGPERVLTTVKVSVADSIAEVGQFTVAMVTTLDQFGAAIDAGPVTFSSTFPEVAGINPTDGRILAIASGRTTIVATVGGKSGSQVMTVSFPPIFINEILPLGAESTGWVELYNPTGSPFDLEGWTITNSDVLHAFTVPAGATIAAGGFFVIEEQSIPGGLQSRDALHLFSRFGVQSDAFTWGHDPETSFGRCPDGQSGLSGLTLAPTKGGPNACF